MEDKHNGHGKRTLADSRCYEGHWVNGQPNG
jgi:hypothetical protein